MSYDLRYDLKLEQGNIERNISIQMWTGLSLSCRKCLIEKYRHAIITKIFNLKNSKSRSSRVQKNKAARGI
jgi:hypothetical protein